MENMQKAIDQIAMTLAKHFDSLYYVNIETGHFIKYGTEPIYELLNIPRKGEDFFTECLSNAPKCVHPDDLQIVTQLFDKVSMLDHLKRDPYYSVLYRIILNGEIYHMRHLSILCDDKKHIICCLENIEDEVRKAEEQKRNLQSALRMARLDALTGIRNKTAFKEYAASISSKIASNTAECHFGIIMCDVNDLKQINDIRGHSFGDEAIQRASRMICEVYDHSPVFRVGGDEFVVILDGRDYDDRDSLLQKLREESIANKRSRSGPVVACGMSVYEQGDSFNSVFQRADQQMYENKRELKALILKTSLIYNTEQIDTPITAERKRLLDSLFGALYTVAGGGYVYLNDMRHDFSRWSLPLVDDFGMQSEYMYHADRLWQEHIHPDDIKIYRETVDATLSGKAEFRSIHYRVRRADGTYVVCSPRSFVLSDKEGLPEYFGGIIIPD